MVTVPCMVSRAPRISTSAHSAWYTGAVELLMPLPWFSVSRFYLSWLSGSRTIPATMRPTMGRYNSSLPQKLGDWHASFRRVPGVLTRKSRLVRWQRTKPSTFGKSGPGPQEGVGIVHEVECGEESTMMDERRTRGSWVKVSEDMLCIVLCAGIT
jgi:hypothetical protein